MSDERQLRFDLGESRAGRDEGIERIVSSNPDWLDRGLAFIESLTEGWQGIGEDIRFLAIPVIGAPTKPKAWGALTRVAVRRGLLAKTGRYLPMKDVRSHARESREYRRSSYVGGGLIT
jgi:hypothetical protein